MIDAVCYGQAHSRCGPWFWLHVKMCMLIKPAK